MKAIKEDEIRKKQKESLLVNCRSVEDFEKLEELGEGTYGRVCKNWLIKSKVETKQMVRYMHWSRSEWILIVTVFQ